MNNSYSQQVRRIEDFVSSNNLPAFVKVRLRKYLLANSQLKKSNQELVFEGVPKILQRDILMYMYRDIVVKSPILTNAGTRFLERIVVHFVPEVFLYGDFLMRQGDLGDELIFITRGLCEIFVYEGKGNATDLDFESVFMGSVKVAERGIGAFIGESSLLSLQPRSASVIASTEIVHTISLSKEAFDKCSELSTDLKANILEEARARKKQENGVSEISKTQPFSISRLQEI